MRLVRVDTQRAYDLIWEKITTLELPPGAPINEQELAEELDMGATPVREALKWLAHENLVEVTERHGIYVADVNVNDLQQLSEMRLSLESLSARLAAERAEADDLVVLKALRREQEAVPPEGSRDLFDLDHKFHQAVAAAAHNKYLAQTLDRLFGLSRRLWYFVLPHLETLSSSVEMHVTLVGAIESGDADQAAEIMHEHVKEFYDEVRQILEAQE
ncbi:MAG: GntR family transcriptional regulator [Chloroflexota bacterium]|nr:GntR family transcriptional regulator [Chloroflexota bacterium]